MKPIQNKLILDKNGLQSSYFPLQQPAIRPISTKHWPEDDVPPPKICQNHYRHIHEQRDFTLENLSMAGETEVLEYDDYKIMADFEWKLDLDIQDMILRQRRVQNSQRDQNQTDSNIMRLFTDGEEETMSTAVNKKSSSCITKHN